MKCRNKTGGRGPTACLQARRSGANVIFTAPARAGNPFAETGRLDMQRIHAVCRSEYDPMPLLQVFFTASPGAPFLASIIRTDGILT